MERERDRHTQTNRDSETETHRERTLIGTSAKRDSMRMNEDDDDCFYIALFSALEQTHCARM